MIELERHENVFVLTMVDGENRWTTTFTRAFAKAIDEVAASDGPAALVTASAHEKFFSNGLDVEWIMGSDPDHPGGDRKTFGAEFMELMGRIITLPVPTVCAVNGHGFGAGFMSALCHDVRIMREDRGYWCLPEVDLKMPLPDNMIALLQARYTKAVVHEAAVSGGRFNAAQCLERRLVDRAVPEDQVLPAAIEYAASQANKDRSTLAGIKQALYKDVMPRLVRAK